MQIRPEQLEAQLGKSLSPFYTVHGDEPLLALEAADAVRAAARKRGFDEREVFYAERGFDWSELKHAGASMSLFGGRKLIELRMPTGKPGTQGAETIAALCGQASPDTLFLVSLPRLDRSGQSSAWFSALGSAGVVVDVYQVERNRLPAWIGERLGRQKQRAPKEVLEFLADRVEGNLLAAHQEIQKLALLAPAGELTLEIVRDAVAQVARYDAYDASEALLKGDIARFARVVEGLRGEGEPPTFLLWVLVEDLRALGAIQAGLESGQSMDNLMRESRIRGPRQAVFKGAVRRISRTAIDGALLRAAQIDRAIKGLLKRDAWDEFLKFGMELR